MISAEDFKKEVNEWATRIGVSPKQTHIRPMKRKWASCSSKGRLTFDKKLLNKSADFRKEVIVHELLHLKLPNHGKMFKALHQSYLRKGNQDNNSQ